MEREIIDLTASPRNGCIGLDTDEQGVTGLRRRSKKRRREEDTPSSTRIRERSVKWLETHPYNSQAHSSGSEKPVSKEYPCSSRSPSVSKDISSPQDIFFVDLAPALLTSEIIFGCTTLNQESESNVLLLPAHVSVVDKESTEILPPSSPSSGDDYIDYLDFDDSVKNAVRYFDDSPRGSHKPRRTVCKNCGAEGEHTSSTCPILICLTCGARDEHSTRSCPISKTCFTCGMKGHINATCPNRRAVRRGELDLYDNCERCGSIRHKSNECPTLWRLYEYLSEALRNHNLQMRRQKRPLRLGAGGEGYVAEDQWCYNCGSCGHWGDDCREFLYADGIPDESSAFSEHNTLSGPFFNSVIQRDARESGRGIHHNREALNSPLMVWGNDLPDNVGKRARRKNLVEMEQIALDAAAEDDPDDWFRRPKNARNLGALPGNGRRPGEPRFSQESEKSLQSSRPSLLARIGAKPNTEDFQSKPIRPRSTGHNELGGEHGQRGKVDFGPRYKGGYSK